MVSERKNKKIKIFTGFVSEIADLSVSQTLKVGAIAIKVDFSKIGSFGYNGSYTGAPSNETTGGEEESLDPGQSGFVHAEMNLVAKFRESDPENYIVLLTHSPCEICSKILINSGFKYIFWGEEYRKTDHLCILNELGILSGNFTDLTNNYQIILEAYLAKKN
jgi:dCMP deaminase